MLRGNGVKLGDNFLYKIKTCCPRAGAQVVKAREEYDFLKVCRNYILCRLDSHLRGNDDLIIFMRIKMLQQLSLSLRLRDEAKFSNFYQQNNEQVVRSLQEMAAGNGEQFIYLWGAASSGRTHLLHAVCAQANELHRQAVYIPLGDFTQLQAEILEGLEHTADIICIDDIQSIATHSEWEQALFHFYNRVRQSNSKLIITGNTPPAQLAIKLPDLLSRLAWGLCLTVHSLKDEEKLSALQLRAQCRGLKLSEAVGRFLLNRYSRDMSALFNVLEELDSHALVAQRALTIPFVKEVLEPKHSHSR